MEKLIVDIISNNAFPIVAFILMYNMCNTTLKEVTASLTKLSILIEKEEKDD